MIGIECPGEQTRRATRRESGQISELAGPGKLTHLDRDALATYCTAVVHYRQAAELTALAEADPTFARVTLKAWKYGQLVQTSSELLADSSVGIESFLSEDTGRGALGRAVGASLRLRHRHHSLAGRDHRRRHGRQRRDRRGRGSHRR